MCSQLLAFGDAFWALSTNNIFAVFYGDQMPLPRLLEKNESPHWLIHARLPLVPGGTSPAAPERARPHPRGRLCWSSYPPTPARGFGAPVPTSGSVRAPWVLPRGPRALSLRCARQGAGRVAGEALAALRAAWARGLRPTQPSPWRHQSVQCVGVFFLHRLSLLEHVQNAESD